MNLRSICGLLALLLASAGSVRAARLTSPDGDLQVNLRPAPKEVQLHAGGFRVKAATRIVVELGHQSEDRIAAETLAEEIANQSGVTLSIVGAKSKKTHPEKTILLARLQDLRVQRFLASKGLKDDASIGERGYLLFSDKSHLIVAANTGEGVFYGVQTLRQLLRPDGKGLICPAVEIRDWPGLQPRGAQSDLSSMMQPKP
jgi:hexosaminidase